MIIEDKCVLGTIISTVKKESAFKINIGEQIDRMSFDVDEIDKNELRLRINP